MPDAPLRTDDGAIHRVVRKNGAPRVRVIGRNWAPIIYCNDFANTLLTIDSKWSLLFMCGSFLATWLLFALFWVAIARDDALSPEDERCLAGIDSFLGYLLFSIETQTTIGYGTRNLTHQCPEAVFLLCVQVLAGVFVGGLLIQCVYERASAPRQPHSKECFSEKAVICQRDGRFCLVFRVRDPAGRYRAHNQVAAYLIQKQNGEICLKSVKLERIGILIWPIEIVHRIDAGSPFWDLSASDLITKSFEMVVSMDGTSLSTSSTSHLSASFVSSEVLWGHVFVPCTAYDKPTHSARRLQEVQNSLRVGYYSPQSSLDLSSTNGTDSGISSAVTMSPMPAHREGNYGGEVVKVVAPFAEPVFVSLKLFLVENRAKFEETAF